MIFTDHKPLKFLFESQNIKCPKIQRWALLLLEYNVNVEYCIGTLNVEANAFSRLSSQPADNSLTLRELEDVSDLAMGWHQWKLIVTSELSEG